MTETDAIAIRRAETIADYRACQEAQRRAWGLTEDNYVVPIATMVGAQHHGGLVLGAFLPDGRAVGMSFAFLGRVEGRLCLYSQLTGIVPEYQDRGLGSRLKHAQRAIARSEGIEQIAWAFDPFQPGNARFNLEKLGATCGRYIVDMYGPRTDALNAGTPTDRLIAEWPTTPQRITSRITVEDAWSLPRWINVEAWADRVLVAEPSSKPPVDATHSLIEIPVSLAALRNDDPEGAERWRAAVRAAFLEAFARGHRAERFVRGQIGGYDRAAYVLGHATLAPDAPDSR